MGKNKNRWTERSKELVKALHKEISLTNSNWHELKGLHDHRAAELLTGALSQLINDGETADIEQLITQATKWIKKEIKDPGCPRKKLKQLN